VTWFAKSAAFEAEAPETDEDRLAHVEAELIFAERAWDAAVRGLRSYNDAHRQMPMSFTNGETVRIITMCNDAERRHLEKDVRVALARRNKALSDRADLMLRLGLIR